MDRNATNLPAAAPLAGPALRIRNLAHCFGEGELRKQVLFDNHLEIAPGEIVIMTGPSGSGKTTLLTLIGALRTVQEGSVEVLGRQMCGADRDALIASRREIGFIFQNHNLFASLTALQNVRMALEIFPSRTAEMNARCEEMLARGGWDWASIHYKPASLSGGQRQRVAVARGLVHRPRLVLADEPTAALDEKSGREVVALFQELSRAVKTTILMVTHDNRVLDIADRIVNMVDGRIKSNVLVRESAMACEFLRGCPLFAQLTPRTLTHVADRMLSESHPAGAVVVRQGDPGDKFYLIRSGTAEVFVDDDPGRRSLAALGRGDFFGEAALLTGNPRNATVVAREPLELYALGKDDFDDVIRGSATFQEELRKVLFERQ